MYPHLIREILDPSHSTTEPLAYSQKVHTNLLTSKRNWLLQRFQWALGAVLPECYDLEREVVA